MQDRTANLHAFARLYGVVRWFHPSDAAASADWDDIAIQGVRYVADASDGHDLADRLRTVFAPVAATIQLVERGQRFADAHRADPDQQVWWEHFGYGEDQALDYYRSKRRSQPRMVPLPGNDFVAVGQRYDARPFRGATLRLHGKVRADAHGSGGLWLRVDGAGRSQVHNMQDRPVRDRTWTVAEIDADVPEDADQVFIGAIAQSGTMWFDDLELSVRSHDGWQPISVRDGDFSTNDPLQSWHSRSTNGWSVQTAHDPASASSALRLSRLMRRDDEELFADSPAPDEAYELDLGEGLHARVPLALPATALGGVTDFVPHLPAWLLDHHEPSVDIADVIVAWNALRHFWPYADVEHVDWDRVLDDALVDALRDRTEDDHLATLERLIAAVPDGHASVACRSHWQTDSMGMLPFDLGWVEGQVVVTASGTDAVHVGDVIESIDAHPIAGLVAERLGRTSGSPQWKQRAGLDSLLMGFAHSSASIGLRRAGRAVSVSVMRSRPPFVHLYRHPPIERVGVVWYVDLSQASWSDLETHLDDIANAPGVVFDLRQRPGESDRLVLAHLLNRTDTAKWMKTPHLIRPDFSGPVQWTDDGWGVTPAMPTIKGKVAFLIGPETISYGESITGIVAYYRLGQLVGEGPTAGANGSMAVVELPGGCETYFTGMVVTKLDGSRLFGVGFAPDIKVTPTLAAVAAGHDEVYEAGLATVAP